MDPLWKPGQLEECMKCIESLLAKVTKTVNPRLLSNGFACWLVNAQAVPGSFFHSLADIGGWPLAEESNQSLWFFPKPEVMLGLARLHNWGRLHPMPTSITVFEASLIVDEDLNQSLKVKAEAQNLCAEFSKKLTIRVVPRLRELARTMPGISFKQVQSPDGLAGEWFELEGNEQVGVIHKLAWLWLIRPLGNRQDKAFIKGWRLYFDRLEAIFNQNKISYLHGDDQTLVLRITSVRALAKLVDDLMVLMGDRGSATWPCQYMAVEMGDNLFAPDFPTKVRLLLEPLEANTLYLPLGTIYHLADRRLSPVNSRISVGSTKLTDLFQVEVKSGQSGSRRGSIGVLLPSSLVSGSESICYYCGLRSHLSGKCPSRILQPGNVQVSDLARFARIDMKTLPEIMLNLEKHLAANVGRGLSELLHVKDDRGLVVGAMFETKMVCQLRMMALVWRAKGKDWPRGIETQHPQNEPMLFEALDNLRTGSPERAAEKLERIVLKSHKNFQPRVLMGFMAMERDEFKRAASIWEEGESLVYTSLQRSYMRLLLGRLREMQGNYTEAIHLYGRAFAESPGFSQARYRQASCLIKTGYINEALAIFRDLINSEPDYFSAILLDPELESGRSHLQSELWEIWEEAKSRSKEIIGAVEHLPDLLAKWLPENHSAYRSFHDRIAALNSYAGVNNFASQAKLLQGTLAVRHDIQTRVKKDIQELSDRRKVVLERLKTIKNEASWFPFPSMLKSFNALFNHCAAQLALVGELDLHVPDKFRRGHEAMQEAESSLQQLEKKLILLLGFRNGMLFSLLAGKYLLIFELVALVLAGALSVGLFFFAPNQVIMGRDLRQDRWLILNISLIFFSFMALVIAAIKAVSRFESYKNEVLRKGKG